MTWMMVVVNDDNDDDDKVVGDDDDDDNDNDGNDNDSIDDSDFSRRQVGACKGNAVSYSFMSLEVRRFGSMALVPAVHVTSPEIRLTTKNWNKSWPPCTGSQPHFCLLPVSWPTTRRCTLWRRLFQVHRTGFCRSPLS